MDEQKELQELKEEIVEFLQYSPNFAAWDVGNFSVGLREKFPQELILEAVNELRENLVLVCNSISE